MNLFKFFFPAFFRRIELLELIVSNTNTHNNKFREQIVENQNTLFEGLKRAHEIIAEQAVLLDSLGVEVKEHQVDINSIDELLKDMPNIRKDIRELKQGRRGGIKVRDEILDRIEKLESGRKTQIDINRRHANRLDAIAGVPFAKVPPITNTASVVAVSEMRGAYARDDVKSLHDVYTTILLASDRARFSFQRLVGKVVACGPYPESYEDHKGRHIGLYCVDKLQPVFIALGIQHINPHHIAKDLAARK